MGVAVLSDNAKIDMIVGGLLSDDSFWVVNLFTNNHTPVAGDDTSAFTLASYPGYGSATWSPGTPGINGSDKAVVTPFSDSFAGPTSGGSDSIYGYTVRYTRADGTHHTLMSALFPSAPIVLANNSQSITVNLAFDDYDANNP